MMTEPGHTTAWDLYQAAAAWLIAAAAVVVPVVVVIAMLLRWGGILWRHHLTEPSYEERFPELPADHDEEWF